MHGRFVRGPTDLVQALDDVPALFEGQGLELDEFRRGARSAVEQDAKIEGAGPEVVEDAPDIGRGDEKGVQTAASRRPLDEADEVPVVFPIVGDGQVVSCHG